MTSTRYPSDAPITAPCCYQAHSPLQLITCPGAVPKSAGFCGCLHVRPAFSAPCCWPSGPPVLPPVWLPYLPGSCGGFIVYPPGYPRRTPAGRPRQRVVCALLSALVLVRIRTGAESSSLYAEIPLKPSGSPGANLIPEIPSQGLGGLPVPGPGVISAKKKAGKAPRGVRWPGNACSIKPSLHPSLERNGGD